MQPHDRIIAEVAKNMLVTEGLFRKGRSRVWLEDCGFFLIQVEFQPSAYAKGSYLNVGVSFLFEHTRELDSALPYSFGGRELEFTEYRDDLSFQAAMEKYAQYAKKKVRELRKFQDFDHARKKLQRIICRKDTDSFCWEMYDLAMLSFLFGSFDEGQKLLRAVMTSLDRNSTWFTEVHDLCSRLQHCQTQESAQKSVQDMVNHRREYFSSKPSFCKMKGMFAV